MSDDATRDDTKAAERSRLRTFLIALGASVLVLFGAYVLSQREPAKSAETGISSRTSATVVVAVRDLARLETTELHIEKVIDLTDNQSRFFGLIEGSDAILLVAAGDVTIGVDLGKVLDEDITFDPKTRAATIRVPAPEIFSTRLDESKTYVYARTTSLVAKRNEHLEQKARQEALAAMEKAAREGDAMERAKKQTEKELKSLGVALGISDFSVSWK
jgi:Protein of unknown function (DUF4230)